MARRIADGPRVAFAYMKRNLHAAETEPLATVLDMEALGQARTGTTEDHKEAARAFVEKRSAGVQGPLSLAWRMTPRQRRLCWFIPGSSAGSLTIASAARTARPS